MRKGSPPVRFFAYTCCDTKTSLTLTCSEQKNLSNLIEGVVVREMTNWKENVFAIWNACGASFEEAKFEKSSQMEEKRRLPSVLESEGGGSPTCIFFFVFRFSPVDFQQKNPHLRHGSIDNGGWEGRSRRGVEEDTLPQLVSVFMKMMLWNENFPLNRNDWENSSLQ